MLFQNIQKCVCLTLFLFSLTFQQEYSRFDGWYNNEYRPDSGTANQPLVYHTHPEYVDKVSEMLVDDDSSRQPSAKSVSVGLMKSVLEKTSTRDDQNGLNALIADQNGWNALFAFYGQLVVNEILASVTSGKRACPPEKHWISNKVGGSENCEKTAKGCQQTVKKPFYRAAFDKESGRYVNNPRRPINFVTSWVDGNVIYGDSEIWANHIRNVDLDEDQDEIPNEKKGKLKFNEKQAKPEANKGHIPLLNRASPHEHPHKQPLANLYALGNFRSNQNPPLLALSLVWHLYHNKMADKIAKENESKSDEYVFQQARKKTVAAFQSVMMYEYLPALTGMSLDPYHEYKPSVDPSISVEFQVAFRVGHSLIPSRFYSLNDTKGHCFNTWSLCNFWWDSNSFFENKTAFHNVTDGVEAVIRGLMYQSSETPDLHYSSALTNHLFGSGVATTKRDLASLDVMRGRDMGVASYNRVSKAYGFDGASSWDQSDTDVRSIFEVYNRNKTAREIKNSIELLVGGLYEASISNNTYATENKTSHSGVGALFNKIIFDQFRRIRDADRFWFENENSTADKVTFREVLNAVFDDKFVSKDDSRSFYMTNSTTTLSLERKLNDENLGCTEVNTHDLFDGSEASFIISFIILALIPLICIAIGYYIYYARQREQFASSSQESTDEELNNTIQMRDSRRAIEYLSPKEQRIVQIQFVNNGELKVLSRVGEVIRTINVNCYAVRYKIKKSHDTCKDVVVVLELERDYDLVLLFDSLNERERFLDGFKEFMDEAEIHYETTQNLAELILANAKTYSVRQVELKQFFKTAFNQVYKATEKAPSMASGKRTPFPWLTPKKNKNETIDLNLTKSRPEFLNIELTRDEFASALAVQPNSIFVQKMFLLADSNGNGYISFAEWIDLLAMLSKGDENSKMKLLFQMYDFDGNGDLDKDEFKILIQSLVEISNRNFTNDQIQALTNELLNESGSNGKGNRGSMNLDQFTGLITNHQNELWKNELCFVKTDKKRDSKDSNSNRQSDIEEQSEEQHISESFVRDLEAIKTELPDWKVKWNMTKQYIENNWNKIIVMSIFGIINAYLFVNKFCEYANLKEHTGVRKVTGMGAGFSRGGASALAFSYVLVLLSVCRNLCTKLRETKLNHYIPFDEAITFHRYAAYVASVFSVIHVIGHAINFYHISTQPKFVIECILPEAMMSPDFVPKFHYWAFMSVPGTTGILLVIVLSIIFIFATPTARKYIFQTFWITHGLFPLVYILLVIHGLSQMLQKCFVYTYLIIPAVLYVFDWIVSLRQRELKMEIVDAEALPSDVLKIEFKLPSEISYSSGQWVRVSCDAINRKEYHPFTIASAPHEKTLQLYIRGLGPWTFRIKDVFTQQKSQTNRYPKMHLIGPFGSSNQDWYKYKTLVLVGAGIGVTPYASILKDLVYKVYTQGNEIACKKVYFIWIARNHQQFEWFTDILREVEEMDTKGIVQIDIFVTQLLKDFDLRTMMLYVCEQNFQRMSNRSLFTGLRARTHFGRTDFQAYFTYVKRQAVPGNKIGVFTCGPASVISCVTEASKGINKLENSPLFVSHYELF